MDPAFWGDPPNEATRLASTKQMLTKYVALTFFHLPESFDPTSILYSPLEPDGGSDDIYESDLHPEQSANGRRGTPNPCLFFRYSYKTHKVIPHDPVLADCVYDNPAMSTDEETFTTNLAWGIMIQKGVDLELNSIPAIEFRRGYNSSRNIPLSLGVGATHSFDSYISSDDSLAQTVMSINREDEAWYYLDRMDKGRGFDAGSVYKSTEHPMYGARQTWESNHYKIQYRDGSWSTYLSCAGEHEHCYWTHYQDAKGNSFEFDRGPNRELRQIRTNDHKGIDFKFDDKSRTVRARATNGRQVFYEYDAAGCLARVHRMDGQVTLYGYRTPCRMTSMSVVRQPGAAPETVLTNELDARSRIMKQTLAGLGTYTIQYVRTVGEKNWEWRVTDPAGQTWRINMNSDFYLARTGTVRFPAETRQ